MCGVFGAVRSKQSDFSTLENVLDACKRLEYRGYDSSGVAWVEQDSIQVLKELGSVDVLRKKLSIIPTTHIAMGHTRWATHGKACASNAHPMRSKRFALVHNGIVDEHEKYRMICQREGFVFTSETDTETLVMMMEYTSCMQEGSVESWMPDFLAQFHGQWSIVWMDNLEPDTLYAYCQGRPLFVSHHPSGYGLIGSDVMGLASYSDRCALVGEKSWVKITAEGVWRYEAGQWNTVPLLEHGCRIEPQTYGEFGSFMLKEIHQQPENIRNQYQVYESSPWMIEPWIKHMHHANEIVIVACGSSYYAGLVARYAMERQLKKRVVLEMASEFNYRQPVLLQGSLVVAISQSGETADTLAALELAKRQGIMVGVLCNVASSIMALEADILLPLLAGPEIGVASTKAFSAQVFALLYLSQKMVLGEVLEQDVEELILVMQEQIASQIQLKSIAERLSSYQNVMYVGRDQLYPIAAEGALKLKEITYIHAECYAAGELKHGPIALIDDKHPTVALVEPAHRERMYANIEEIRARSGEVIVLESALEESGADLSWRALKGSWLQSLSFVVPLQLLAYYAAKNLGHDVDRPRNLAKCVTVE